MIRFRLRGLLAFTTVVAVIIGLLVRWWPIDGLLGNLLALGAEEDTVWAHGYSDSAFQAVRAGMGRREVYRLLGRPLRDWGDQEEWTYSPGDTHYRQRIVYFAGDVVVKKQADVWFD
jgi:hypothetical protein